MQARVEAISDQIAFRTVLARQRFARMSFLAILLGMTQATLVGCGGRCIRPPALYGAQLDTNKIPLLPSGAAITVVNAQETRAEYLFLGRGVGLFVELGQWSEAAANLLKRALRLKGVTVVNGTQRVLKLSVSEIRGSRYSDVIVVLSASTSDGYEARYEKQGFHEVAIIETVERAAAGALIGAIETMLEDPKIVAFLEGADSTEPRRTEKTPPAVRTKAASLSPSCVAECTGDPT